MYDTVWDEDPGEDPKQRAAIEATLCHVGQVPPQLFTASHGQRVPVRPPSLTTQELVSLKRGKVTAALIRANGATLFCTIAGDRVIGQYSVAIGLEGVTVEFRQSAETGGLVRAIAGEGCVLLGSGAVIDGGRRVLERVSALAWDRGFWAAVADDSSVRLGPGLDFSVPFYGDTVGCCAVSVGFKLAVAGTVTQRIVVISLFGGAKVNVVSAGARPEMVIITEGWGFIVVYAQASGKPAIIVYDVNGRLLKSVEIPGAIKCWSTWTTRDGFDWLLWVGKDGRVYAMEAFICEVKEPIGRVLGVGAVACAWCEGARAAAVITEDGQVFCLPAPEWM
jgi:hypothetical protein